MNDFLPADTDFVARLVQACPDLTLVQDTAPYMTEPRGRFTASGGVVVQPRSTAQVATCLRVAQAHNVAVVPYGGGTGLVGGQIGNGLVPLILSLEKMTQIREAHPSEDVLVVEAGVILADAQSKARQMGRLVPLSLASEGSARIGGLLATNAGGVNVLRYGNAREMVLGLEVVLADGTIWNGLSRLRKDNAGYDLRHLMIGSEGTLGIITAAALRLSPIPAGTGVALMTVPSPQAALDLLSLARDHVAEGITAFELISRQGLQFLAETVPDLRLPFDTPPEWSVLIELGLPRGLDPATALEELFIAGQEKGLVSDGLIARSAAQADAFWAVREHIPEGNRRIGAVSSHDISVPLSNIPVFIAQAGPALAAIADFRVNCFGHVGDGNLHYNVFAMPGRSRADHENQRDTIKETIHDLVHSLGGSVAAEHGVGRLKTADMARYADPAKLGMMRAIKDALDPTGILNPGAVLPQP